MLWLRSLAFTLAVPCSVGLWVPLVLARSTGDLAIPAGARRLALLAVPAGLAVYACCLLDFVRRGRGTPAPIDAPRTLVTSGPFAWVRNPMYLGVTLSNAGLGVALSSWAVAVYGAAMALVFHAFVVGYEERALRRRFPDDYDRYAGGVRRWLPRRPG